MPAHAPAASAHRTKAGTRADGRASAFRLSGSGSVLVTSHPELWERRLLPAHGRQVGELVRAVDHAYARAYVELAPHYRP